MALRIGPTFLRECKAAGITNWQWSIAPDTGEVFYNAEVPAAQRTILAGVIASHDPNIEGTDDVRDAFLAAKVAVQAMVADDTIPAKARQAVGKLGLCVEELLKYLRGRIL